MRKTILVANAARPEVGSTLGLQKDLGGHV